MTVPPRLGADPMPARDLRPWRRWRRRGPDGEDSSARC